MADIFCTCRKVINELDILFCETCGDVCCDDCALICSFCGSCYCINCSTSLELDSCCYCGNEYLQPILSSGAGIDDVFVVFCGNTYHISNKNGMATELVERTDLFRTAARLVIDIKGLGVLAYSYRSIRKKDSSKELEYYLHFDAS